MYSFSTSFCTVPLTLRMSAPCRSRHSHVQSQQNGSRGVDGHRRRNFIEVDAIEQALHVFDGIDRHADFANFAHGQRVVRIHANLRGQIECDGESGGALARRYL